ncbi:MAG: AMP-binding protein [Promethearchaeia archaeon]
MEFNNEIKRSDYKSRFWKNNWDEGLEDLDPNKWKKLGSFDNALRHAFETYPNRNALSFLGVEITFRELDKYSNQFANMLLDKGFQKGDIVAIAMPNIPEYIIAIVGGLKAGCTVSGVSPLFSDVQMEYQLNDLGSSGRKICLVTLDAIFEERVTKIHHLIKQIKLVVAGNLGDFLPAYKRFLGKLLNKIPKGKVTPLPEKEVLDFHNDILNTYPHTAVNVEVDNEDIAFIQYTGGTTGTPKGAKLTHKNILSDLLIVQEWLGWEEGKGTALSGFPFFHIAGLFFCENCLYLGWQQCLIPDPRDASHICDEIEKYKPTALVNVPSLFQILLKEPEFKELDHSNLEFCISAASPFPVESQEKLEAIIGEGKLLEVYGMTETSPLTTMNPAHGEKKLGSIGLPLLNTELKLVAPDTGEEVPIGEPGEICVKGPQVMKGYLNKPEETEKAIDSEGYMHTGDVAIMDEEGYLRIVDRTKDMINVSGYKVFSTKVEDTLSKHPAIDMIALVGVDNPERPGSEIVKAYIKLTAEYEETPAEEVKADIIEYAKEHCAPYEVPKIIDISKEMPMTGVGKIDKKILRD